MSRGRLQIPGPGNRGRNSCKTFHSRDQGGMAPDDCRKFASMTLRQKSWGRGGSERRDSNRLNSSNIATTTTTTATSGSRSSNTDHIHPYPHRSDNRCRVISGSIIGVIINISALVGKNNSNSSAFSITNLTLPPVPNSFSVARFVKMQRSRLTASAVT